MILSGRGQVTDSPCPNRTRRANPKSQRLAGTAISVRRSPRRNACSAASRACPFDLHALLPVPDAILALGPNDPASLAWLAEHWGTERLRQVCLLPEARPGRRLPAAHDVVSYGFFTHDATPHAAVARLGARWPALRLALRPRPD